MCDWPVWDGYYRDAPPRMCANHGGDSGYRLSICGKHFEIMLDEVLHGMRRQAEHLESLGRVEPGSIERQLRREVDELARKRNPRPRPMNDEESPDNRKSWVYFAEREGFVKIGTTRELQKRMKALAAGGSMVDGMTVGPLNLLATVPGTRDNEQYFHQKFAHLRIDPKREWFLFDAELRAFVAGLKNSTLAGVA